MSQHLEIWQVTEPRRPSAARAATMQQSEFGFFWQADGGEDHGPFSTFDEALGDYLATRSTAQRHHTVFEKWWDKRVESQ